jgi:hypothetical protein
MAGKEFERSKIHGLEEIPEKTLLRNVVVDLKLSSL